MSMGSRYVKSSVPLQVRLATNEKLLAEIAVYCTDAGISASSFGKRAVNDGKLVSRLRCGGRASTETVKRIREYIANRTAGLPEPG